MGRASKRKRELRQAIIAEAAKGQRFHFDDGRVAYHKETPSIQLTSVIYTGLDEDGQHWECGNFYGTVKSWEKGFPWGDGPYKILSIANNDNSAAHDWRAFQQVKNLVIGLEWEGLELYPAESRLKDTSNYFILWCVPRGVIPWGFTERDVLTPDKAFAPQRPFPEKE